MIITKIIGYKYTGTMGTIKQFVPIYEPRVEEQTKINNMNNIQADTLTFGEELQILINKYSKENDSDTPDYLLAQYLVNCLHNYSETVKLRDKWFGIDPWSEDKRIHTPPNDTLSRVINEFKKEHP